MVMPEIRVWMELIVVENRKFRGMGKETQILAQMCAQINTEKCR